MNKWHPFGNNILFLPQSKNKIVGDTSRFFLYGRVIDIGDDVKTVKVGDVIGVTQWALNKIVMEDKSEHYFCPENSDFILGILRNEAQLS